MDGYIGSAYGTEIYLMQGSMLQQHLTTTPGQKIDAMDKGTPEFIVDQGLYYPAATNYPAATTYPAATNYYGYYCTGFESSSEWDDHQRFFGLGGQDPHYAGLVVENSPYVYYTPSVGYAHSSYNPYNPYVPGAVLGVDGSYVGEQQYYAGTTYENYVPSPSYYPIAIQSIKDSNPTSAPEPRLLSTTASRGIKPDAPRPKLSSPASLGVAKTPPKSSSENARPELANGAWSQTHNLLNTSNVAVNTQTVAPINITSNGARHSTPSAVSQGNDVSVSNQASYQFLLERPSSLPVANGSSNYDVVGVRPRSQYGDGFISGKTSSDFLREQNRGPRTNKWTSTISVKAYRTEASNQHTDKNIIIHADQYNKEDFPVNYTNAKFFVIKSYSEDDVHKSIKYNVWSSTSTGNKRLDIAYEDAKRIACGKPKGCPIFLFFSVNASGQFCGVAEMIGPVDFHKDMGFWQHDKWKGSFPVKWHMIKDVSNNYFRHIILENNENRPVTSSRDTQDIRYAQGMEMLHIFKNYSMKTSILNDFKYYEDRQKIMMEEKAKFYRRNYTSSFYGSTSVPLDHLKVPIDSSNQVEKPNDSNVSQGPRTTAASTNKQVLSDPDDDSSASELANPVRYTDDCTSVLKLDSLTIDQKPAEANSLAASETVPSTEAVEVLTIGSIKVESCGTVNVGTIPIHLGGLKLDKSVQPAFFCS